MTGTVFGLSGGCLKWLPASDAITVPAWVTTENPSRSCLHCDRVNPFCPLIFPKSFCGLIFSLNWTLHFPPYELRSYVGSIHRLDIHYRVAGCRITLFHTGMVMIICFITGSHPVLFFSCCLKEVSWKGVLGQKSKCALTESVQQQMSQRQRAFLPCTAGEGDAPGIQILLTFLFVS